jgi:outer membrane protein OmpA-like peptidoglycan-associated protein
MGKRSRLFASAAFPLLSLTLAFEPAAATALREQAVAPLSNDAASSAAVNGAATFEVAQEQPAPDGQSEEELKKRKKPGGAEQGEPQGKKHEAAPAQQGGAEPQRKMKEAQPEGQPEQLKPGKQQQETEQPKALQPQATPETQQAQPEQKKHKQNAEQQPAAQPEATPQTKAVQQQAAPESQPQAQPELKKHQKSQGQAAEPAQQPAEQQAAPAQKQAPAAQQSQSEQAQPETQGQPELKKHQKKQGQTAEPAQQPAEQQAAPTTKQAPSTEQQATPAPKQAPSTEQAQPKTQVQPGTQVEPGTQQGQKPSRKLPLNEQQTGQQPATTPEQQPAQKSQQLQAQPQNQAAPQTGKQLQPNVETGAPAQGNAVQAPANGAVQEGAQTAAPAAAPVSPQELERRKKIAENPAASNETVILPVQNGAAVLDSDKDAARRGFRQGGQAAGGQAGQGQTRGQVQTQQGQNAPVQPAYSKAPTSDAEAQRALGGQQQQPVKIEAITSEQGRRLNRRPDFAAPEGIAVQPNDNQGNRVILNIDNNYVVRHDDSERFVRDGERPIYEQLPRDRYRETIDRPDGDRIITVRNRYGDVIQRSRVDARGREYVLFYSPELEDQPDRDNYFRDPGDELPPMRLRIPLNQYIIDTGTERDSDYYDFLREPPVEPVERVYSLNEVRYSARIRDKVRRIDLDTITFATGSAEIPMSQASSLRGVADAMSKIVKKDPTETFLIEGHTDAVGTAQSNLVLSDQRAESVANVLSDVYGIPPENLVTQGYGEQYLKVNTQGPEQENRRVTIRRVTALVRPVASNQ